FYGAIGAKGIYNNDFIGKPKTLNVCFDIVGLIECYSKSGDFYRVFQKRIVICVKVIIIRIITETIMARLPILMYHHVALEDSKGLTISEKHLESQFSYLAAKGYNTFHFNELDQFGKAKSKKNIIITFDDAYVG